MCIRDRKKAMRHTKLSYKGLNKDIILDVRHFAYFLCAREYVDLDAYVAKDFREPSNASFLYLVTFVFVAAGAAAAAALFDVFSARSLSAALPASVV